MYMFAKIEKLREQLYSQLDPIIKEYVQAELDYSSEIANGYIAADQRAAEQRLIKALNNMLSKV